MAILVKTEEHEQRSGAFRAAAEAIVPEINNADEQTWAAISAIVQHALSQRPARMQRQLALFVRILNLLSYVKHGRPLYKLSLPKRTQLLEGVQNSRLLLLRRGFWGLRTLVLMGYYARPDAMQAVGYRAHRRGWEMRV